MNDHGARATRERISVVVPTLDEEAALDATLAALGDVDELVVSDGGSRDRTAAIARTHGARWIEGAPGRGGQLARGAAAASGEILLFLHADTRLPRGAPDGIRRAIAGGAVGGAFELRFDSPRRLLRCGEAVIRWRTRLCGFALGDQACFARADVYREIGGFRDWPLLEDLDFYRRLARRGRLATLAPPVVTSARRFEALGAARAVALNWWIFFLFYCGVGPERLAAIYRRRAT